MHIKKNIKQTILFLALSFLFFNLTTTSSQAVGYDADCYGDNCEPCHTCRSLIFCEVDDNDRNKCDGPCQDCSNGQCINFTDKEKHECDDGLVCNNSSECEIECTATDGFCTDSENCTLDGQFISDFSSSCGSQICCYGSETPCADVPGGQCLNPNEIIEGQINLNIFTECNALFKVCVKGNSTPCSNAGGRCIEQECASDNRLFQIENIVHGECGIGFCCTESCRGDDDCEEGFFCNTQKRCEEEQAGCEGGKIEKNKGSVGFIKDETQTSSLDSDLLAEGEICCVPLEKENYKNTSVFFQGITCIEKGNCSVNDMVKLAINISKFLTGIIGSVALLFFIVSGIMLIFSRGNEEQITKGKTMMVQTIIGLLIFLSAYLIIDFVQNSLGVDENSKYHITK